MCLTTTATRGLIIHSHRTRKCLVYLRPLATNSGSSTVMIITIPITAFPSFLGVSMSLIDQALSMTLQDEFLKLNSIADFIIIFNLGSQKEKKRIAKMMWTMLMMAMVFPTPYMVYSVKILFLFRLASFFSV